MQTVIEIISAHLRTISADGLVRPDAKCGCKLARLMPCQSDFSRRSPGYLGRPQPGYYWSMYTTRDAAAESLRAMASTTQKGGA